LIVTSYKGGHKGSSTMVFILGMSNVPKKIGEWGNQSGSLQQNKKKNNFFFWETS
jgi:hypothetical protein